MPEEVIGGTPAEGSTGTETPSNSQTQTAANNTGDQTGGTPNEAQVKPIDWASIDPTSIPADVLKKHPEFTKVLDESIQRRQENKRLKAALALEDGEVVEDNAKQKPPTQEQLLQQVLSRLDKLDAAENEKRTNDARLEAAKQAGIPADLVSRIQGNTAAEMLADAMELAKFVAQTRPSQTSATNFGSPDAQAALKKRVEDRLKAGIDLEAPSVFAPGLQRTKGGGPRN